MLLSDWIVNLKNKTLLAIEHVCKYPLTKTCLKILADTPTNKNLNEFNMRLATSRVLQNDWETLNFYQEHILSSWVMIPMRILLNADANRVLKKTCQKYKSSFIHCVICTY